MWCQKHLDLFWSLVQTVVPVVVVFVTFVGNFRPGCKFYTDQACNILRG